MATTYLGKLQGASGALLAVFVDGAQAPKWPGWDGNEDGRNRTLLAQWSETETGAEVEVGSAGVASIWQAGDDIVLLDFFPDEEFEPESLEGRRQLGKRVEELPTRGKPKSQGFVQVESGCLAVMLEYADASGVAKAMKAGAKKLKSFDAHGVLIPLANGRYEILTENLGRSADGHSDELGSCVTRTRIKRAAPKAKPAATPAAPKAGKVDVLGQRSHWWGWTRGISRFTFLALDATDAPRCNGDSDYVRGDNVAFNKQGGGPMRTKAGAEAIASMLGPGLVVTYWKLPGGVGLLDLDHEPKKLDLESKSGRELLGAHFAQLPSVKSTRLGTVTVKSGAICVMRTMAYPEKAPRPTGDKPVVLTQGQGFEVGAAFPVENGVYEVHRDLLGDPKKGVLTEAGRLHVRVRLVRTNHAAAKATAKPAAKPAKAAPAAKPSKAAPAAAPATAKGAAKGAAKGRVHLELSEGTSNKFWEAWVEGSTLYVRFGRIGTEGQTKPKAFKTPAAAAAERDALIASKRKKGYA